MSRCTCTPLPTNGITPPRPNSAAGAGRAPVRPPDWRFCNLSDHAGWRAVYGVHKWRRSQAGMRHSPDRHSPGWTKLFEATYG